MLKGERTLVGNFSVSGKEQTRTHFTSIKIHNVLSHIDPNDDVPLHVGERIFAEKVNKLQNWITALIFFDSTVFQHIDNISSIDFMRDSKLKQRPENLTLADKRIDKNEK